MAAKSVLLLIADDWSPIARCYGDNVVQTPNIDALAKQSMVFQQAFCTTPSCAASRASLLTGLYSHQHGQYGHSHGIHGFRTHQQLAAHTLPAVLKNQNIYTGLVGKAHIQPQSVYPFEFFETGDPSNLHSPINASRAFYKQAGDKPFYLHVASTYPHRNAGNGFDRGGHNDAFFADDILYDPALVPVPNWLPDVPAVREDIAAYYTFISRFDRFVGSMLDELKTAGRADDTMVILMSDHGMPFPGAKASMYDSGHRCPLIIRTPGRDAGVTNALTNWQDLYPTICDFLDVPQDKLPEFLPGKSLSPVLESPDATGWDQTFFSHNFHEVTNYYPYRSLREHQYKFTINLAHELPMPLPSDLFSSPTWQAVLNEKLSHMGKRSVDQLRHHDLYELYDIQNDPEETINLINDPAHAKVAARMQTALQAFRVKTCDPWLEEDYQASRTSERTRPSIIPIH